jgi:hypothetical protein
MPLRRLFLWILMGCVAFVVSYFVLFPHVFRCLSIPYSDFKRPAEQLYVSPDVSLKLQKNAEAVIRDAQRRIHTFWGSRVGNPTIILCRRADQYQRYCNSGEGAGCSIGTPWGDSYIVLNMDGLNTDVIAHEMCHDELFTRLGWWKTTRQIPQWFNEGLALMVDYRFVPKTDSIQRYIDYKDEYLYISGGGQIALHLEEISSMHDFFNGNERHVMLAYMTSGMEVARWLLEAGEAKIPLLVEQVAQGRAFEEVYRQLERKNYNRKQH